MSANGNNSGAFHGDGKVLVTGATGHLGANLVRRLCEEGLPVRALLLPGDDGEAVRGLDIECVRGDIRDAESTSAAVRGCRYVYHCAAKVSTLTNRAVRDEVYACNVLGTANVLRAAMEAGIERVVATGSFSAVGYDPADASRPSDETQPFRPFDHVTPYELSKVLAEQECVRAAAEGLDVVIPISCAIIGPNDYVPSRMGRTLCDFARGRMPAYIPGGFEFVSTRDVVEGHLLAMRHGRPGRRYIISTEHLTVDELMALFERVTGRRRPRLRLPAGMMAGAAAAAGLCGPRGIPEIEPRFTSAAVRLLRMRRRADHSRAGEELGFRPTSIAQAVEEAHACFIRRGVLPALARRSATVGAPPSATGIGPPPPTPPELRERAGRWPVLGYAVEFARDPVGLVRRGRQRHGELFALRMAGRRVAVFTGPKAHEAFFHAPDDQLSPKEIYRFMVPIFGEGIVYDCPPQLMDEQLSFLAPALHGRRLRTYVDYIIEEVRACADRMGDQGEADLLELTNEITTFIASRCLIGPEFRRYVTTEFPPLYKDLEGGISLLACLNPYLPLPAFRRRDRARRRVVELISRVIRQRRSTGRHSEDFVQTLMEARYADGRSLTEDEIAGLILAAIFAGQHTSAVLAAWAGVELLRHPDWRDRVLGELHGQLDRDGLDYDRLQRMPILDRVVKETERLHPPLITLMRQVLRDFEYGGYRVPAGWLAMVSPAVAHRLEDLFEDPHRFDPDRFAPPREEDRKHRYALIAFGGGKHRCMGMAFGYLQVKTIWCSLLREFEFEPVDPDPAPDYATFVVGPKRPCRVRYRRRSAAPVAAPSADLAARAG